LKCLACWEEIDDDTKICPHCGSDQEQVKEFLEIAILRQQPEGKEDSEVINYLKKFGLQIKIKTII